MKTIEPHQIEIIKRLINALIDQGKAEIIIPAECPKPGYWFGGGKLVLDPNGTIWLSGRNRNAGDSRTGLEAGVRGAEISIFRLRGFLAFTVNKRYSTRSSFWIGCNAIQAFTWYRRQIQRLKDLERQVVILQSAA